MTPISPLIRAMRPMQWIKNVFVFTGIIFSKAFDTPSMLLHVIFSAIAFSLVSSCVYIVNDIVDCESDRHHPQKRHRPLASGALSVAAAIILAAIIGISGIALGALVSPSVVALLFCYLLINSAYSLRLKQIVILDVFCIASGFMLRILVGTIGVGIPPSNWLLLCGLMITLFLGFAKRRAEMIAHDKERHRGVLATYTPILLDQMIAISATGVIIGYSLYTMSPDTIRIHQTQNLILTVPFVTYALFRYLFLLHGSQKAEDPTGDLIKDPHITTTIAIWAVVTYCLLK